MLRVKGKKMVPIHVKKGKIYMHLLTLHIHANIALIYWLQTNMWVLPFMYYIAILLSLYIIVTKFNLTFGDYDQTCLLFCS